MKLFVYFSRRFLFNFLAVFALFALLYGLLDMIEVARLFATADISFGQVMTLVALRLPDGLYQIFPLMVLLATVALFLALARSSELVVTRSAGRSALRVTLAPIFSAVVLGILALAIMNPIVAATKTQYEVLNARYSAGVGSTLSVGREGLWLRQGSAQGQTVISAGRASLDGTELFDVTFLAFTSDGSPLTRTEAQSAKLQPGAWALANARQWSLDLRDDAPITAKQHPRLLIASSLTADQIRDGFGTPSAIPIWELPAFIAQLERAGFSARRHQVWFQSELARPVLLVALVLVGAGFTMRHNRFGRTGLMVVMALMIGFAIFFVRNLAQLMGENGQIPVLLAAWAPPAAAILLALGILLNQEDG